MTHETEPESSVPFKPFRPSERREVNEHIVFPASPEAEPFQPQAETESTTDAHPVPDIVESDEVRATYNPATGEESARPGTPVDMGTEEPAPPLEPSPAPRRKRRSLFNLFSAPADEADIPAAETAPAESVAEGEAAATSTEASPEQQENKDPLDRRVNDNP